GFAEAGDALVADGIANFVGRGVAADQIAQLVVDHDQLVDGGAAAIAGVVAAVAAGAIEELLVHDVGGAEVQLHEDFGAGLALGAAVRADLADEPLGHDAFDRGGDQERLDAEVAKAGDGRGGVVSVQRAEHQVAGERGLHGDLGGFQVANLADQDDVRVLAENASKGVGEGEIDLGVDVALADAVDLVLDRVFGGDQL